LLEAVFGQMDEPERTGMDYKKWLRANWDRAAAVLCVVLGGLVLCIGWWGTARTAYPAAQIPYVVSGGIGGALLIALGATLLISADLRDEWQALDQIAQLLRRSTPELSKGSIPPMSQPSQWNG
jgi:hypothetical protein